MRILHLPLNIASQMGIMVRAQNEIGLQARGLAIDPVALVSSDGLEHLHINRRNNWAYRLSGVWNMPRVLRAIRWADVIHWHFGTCALPRNFDLKVAAWLKKPGVVEFWGSDIRIAEVESDLNPYYARARSLNVYPRADNRAESIARQKLFAAAGCECILPYAALQPYIQTNVFTAVHASYESIDLRAFAPIYPLADNPRPLIVHSPSNRLIKGTASVLKAIDALRGQYDFDFRLITDLSHVEALQLMSHCDILIDQMILGSHGSVSLEAMALGKVAVCYIKPYMAARYPADHPIVHATQEDLAEVLARLLTDGQRRADLGRRGRAYIEKYHDARQIAYQLRDIYQTQIDRRTSRT